jgi:hypothetical protein
MWSYLHSYTANRASVKIHFAKIWWKINWLFFLIAGQQKNGHQAVTRHLDSIRVYL